MISTPEKPLDTPLTKEQARAIAERSVSVALSAGAGCGKTFVLTERFLSHLVPGSDDAPPAELSELIAITFTERAAREMRDRIRRQCLARLQTAANDDDANYWWRLLRGLDAARVSTIHSFCATLLRSHAVEAGLDPGFRILEELQANTIWSETIDDTLRERLATRDETTIELVVRYGLERLRTMLHAVRQRQPDELKQWLAVTPEQLIARWQEFHAQQVLPLATRWVAESPHTAALLQLVGEHDFAGSKMQVMRERRDTLLALLPKLGESKTPAADLERIHEAARIQGGGGKKSWPSEELYEEFKAAAESVRKVIDKLDPVLAFDATSARLAAEVGLRWLTLAEHVAEAYAQAKQEQALLDFDDLIARTRQLLTAPQNAALRKRLASHVRLLLVDEFQDTDPDQVALVQALCGDVAAAKLFFVGDRKQSIYRFRGADPTVFRELEKQVPAQGRLPLTLNFRSQPAILDFVNATFAEAMGHDYEALRAHRKQTSPMPAVEFWWTVQPGSNPREPGAMDRARRREADLVARRLNEMFASAEPTIPVEAAGEAPSLRRPEPRDVVLLFRVLSDVQHYEAALRKHGIDYYLVGGHAFYAQQEIFDVLNLLRTLASTCDEVSLAGVLRSPFFALADETLFWLAQHEGGLAAGLFDSVPRDLQGDQRRRVEFAARTLSELRDRKDRMPVADLINEALARTGYDAVLLAEFLGERKLANLRKLIEQARAIDRAGSLTLSDFIVQLSDFVVEQPREALAATHPEETNVVRLMTIHQAKGLEFPVAVVVDVDRPKNLNTPWAIFTTDLGPLVKLPESDDDSPSSGYDLYSCVTTAEDDDETVRLLYVAMTRAADRLILAGGAFDLDAPLGQWTKLLAERFDLHSGKLLSSVKLPNPKSRPRAAVVEETAAQQPAASSHSTHVDLPKLVEQARRLAAEGHGLVPAHVGPIAADASAPREFSFSRLTGNLAATQRRASATLDEADEDDAWQTEIDPRGLGTLVHAVLADAPFNGTADVAALVARHAERHLHDADPTAAAKEAEEMIARFLASPRAAELTAAAELQREIEFLLAWPPDRTANDQSRGGHSLRGYIDCLSRDAAGGWHLLDFKTNHVTKSGLAKTAANYELQLWVYALAAERILGQLPASLRVYFLRPGLEYAYEWNADARRRAVELVNQAIGAAPQPSTNQPTAASPRRRRQTTLFPNDPRPR